MVSGIRRVSQPVGKRLDSSAFEFSETTGSPSWTKLELGLSKILRYRRSR